MLPNKKPLQAGLTNFINYTDSYQVSYKSFLTDFENKAEEYDKQTPGQGYQRAYQETLAQLFKESYVEKLMEGKTLFMQTPEEFVGFFDDLLMGPYLKECEKQGIPTKFEINPKGSLNLATAEAFKKVLDTTHTPSYQEKIAEEFKKGKTNYNKAVEFANEKSSIPKGDLDDIDMIKLVSYANIIEEKRSQRSFREILGNLGAHIREWFAIRKMRSIVEKHATLDLIEQIASDSVDNAKIKDLKAEVNERVFELKGEPNIEKETVFTDDFPMDFTEFSDKIDELNLTSQSFLKK